MTAHQSSSSFVDAAGQIATKLSETATARDKAGQAPFEEVDLLRRSGLLKLLIPAEDGGLGGRWTDALEVTRTIASGDGSIGQLIGYHYVNSLTAELAGTPEQGAAYRRQVAQQLVRCGFGQPARSRAHRAKGWRPIHPQRLQVVFDWRARRRQHPGRVPS
jgi:alkylation response protein AidB-like acyl-CoA dehydrogenase